MHENWNNNKELHEIFLLAYFMHSPFMHEKLLYAFVLNQHRMLNIINCTIKGNGIGSRFI